MMERHVATIRPVIAIFFNDPGFDAYPFDDPEFRRAYHELAAKVRDSEMDCVIVRSMDTYLGGNDFRGGWRFDGRAFIREEGRVASTVIFNRSNFVSQGPVRVINHPDLERLCTDKMETWRRFAALSPRSALVNDAAEAARVASSLQGDYLVAKPVSMERGIGVHIGKREEVLAKIPAYPYLLQEFIDTSGGIPGITAGLHDLRVVIVAGTPVLTYVRVPKAGSFLANFAQGGTCTYLSLAQVPAEAMALCRDIDAELSMYGDRVYSVDMGRTGDGRWQLIELNSKPGLEALDACKDAGRFMGALVAEFTKSA